MDPSHGYSLSSFTRALQRARSNQLPQPEPQAPDMDNFAQQQTVAARELVDLLDYAPPTGDPHIATPCAVKAVHEIAKYTIAALIRDPSLADVRTELLAALLDTDPSQQDRKETT